MKTMKKNAALVLISIFCAVLVMPCIFVSCTNGEEFAITTRPQTIRDTCYVFKDTTIYVEVVDIQGIKKDGNPSLEKTDDTKYRTDYPIVEDGNKTLAATNLNVWAKAKATEEVTVITERNIGLPSLSIGKRSVRQYQDGDYNKVAFDADWVYSWEKASNLYLTVNTMHEMAWYKRFLQMLSSSWAVQFKEIRQQNIGKAYSMEIDGEEVEGTLFMDTLVVTASYYKDDVRSLRIVHPFFMAKTTVEPDPEAKRRYAKDENFITTSNTSGESTFILWEELNNGKNIEVANITSTVKFRLENAKGVVIDLSKDQEFKLSDLTAVEGSEKPVGEPRVVNGISIQEYVTEYTTETNKSKSVFYMYTEKHTFLNPENLGGNIIMKVGKLSFEDKGTSELVSISNEGNFERMQSTSTIVAKYHDRELTGEGIIILRKVKSEEPKPNKELDRVIEKSFDGDKTYVITRFYKDGTYSDTTIVNTYGYEHKLIMPTLERIIPRDNTNFGNPTIAQKGNPSKIGSSNQREGLIFQGMSQNMNSVYSGHSHVIELQYTALQYTEGGKTCNLSVPMWSLNHKETQIGIVRQEVENNRNYDVTPVSFRYNGAFGKGTASVYNTDTEVWNDKGGISTEIGQIGKNFGFDYVNATTSYTYATFYSVMSDNTEKELGKDGVNVYNRIETPNAQILNAENFDISEYQAVLGSKSFVSQREVAGKFGGKFIVKLYRTLYTTKTNVADVAFVLFHEEAEYVPTTGNGFPMDYREYEVSDLGITALTDLGRVNGRDGKKYDSQISASYNGRTNGVTKAEVQLWVKTDNKNGIDVTWTAGNGGMSYYWDYNNMRKVSTAFIYNNSDGEGGIKCYSNGVEVAKASWDEVNQPTGRICVAELGGRYIICQVSETPDKTSFVWHSLMKADNNRVITSIEKSQTQISYNQRDTYIASNIKENADGSVTATSVAGTVTAAAW